MLRQLSIIVLISLIFPLTGFAGTDPMLKQKIGQMLMIGFKGKTVQTDDRIVKAIESGEIGGVVLFDYDFGSKTFDRNIESPAQLRKLTHDLQHYAKTPLLIGIDYEGGKVNRLKPAYGFPDTLSAAAIGKLSDADAEKQAARMAETLQAAGINLDFAPVIDVNVNPDNPVIGKLERSFSSDPEKVAHFASIFSHAFATHHILCSYKHFPGHGSSTGDSHLGFVDVTQTWQPEELDPYKLLLNHPGSCSMVMIAHVIHRGLDDQNYPASLSQRMITGLLRNKLHFQGVVITDDLQMKAITDQYGVAEAVRLSINAGADILVFGNQLVPTPQDPAELVNMIYNDVISGKIPESRIEDAWKRIMQLKQSLAKT